jgi:hypothetical protein
MSMGDCDRTPCPPVAIGDTVDVELDPFRKAALGVESVHGQVVSVTPFLHSLQVGGLFVGGHGSADVVVARRGREVSR